MKKRELTIKDLAEILLPKLWIVVIVSILCSAFAFVYSKFFKEDTYTSYVTFYVESNPNEDRDTTGDNVEVAKEMIRVCKEVINSEKFLTHIASRLEDDYTPSQLRSMITFSQIDESVMFKISVTSTDWEQSRAIAEAFQNETPHELNSKYFKTGTVSSIDEFLVGEDSSPNSKHTVRNTLIAFLASAVGSVLVIWIYSFFDVVIRDKKKLIDNIDVPILGTIPRHELPITQKGEDGHV